MNSNNIIKEPFYKVIGTKQLKNFNKFYRINLIVLILIISVSNILSQTLIFSDNFDSDLSKWTVDDTWGRTNSQKHSGTSSLTESPSGNYGDNLNITAAMRNRINLSRYFGVQLSFWAKYNLEESFDFMYLEISIDNGVNWIQLDKFNGSLNSWTQFDYNIGSFAGYSRVKIRFRFYSDQYINEDGMYIDDFRVTGSHVDNSPPYIVHSGPELYQGVVDNYTVNAQIIDPSGIQSASLYYKVDGLNSVSVSPSAISGNNYTFIIPSQYPGSLVYYKIGAVDQSAAHNSIDTAAAQGYYYISGTYLKYDDSAVDGVQSFTSNRGAAVKMTVPTGNAGVLAAALIRNYTDPNFTNSTMLFHVWSDNAGKPGNDLITPFIVTPSATLTNPFPMTRIDLRSYYDQLNKLEEDFFIGFTVPSGSVHIVNSAQNSNRSYSFNGSSWSSAGVDYEFRAILGDDRNFPVELTSFTAEYVNSAVKLKWQTATEVDNYGYYIEKKNSFNWENIGFIPGYGNSNSPKKYQFEDKNPTGALTFNYRLKQVDNDGEFKYYDPVSITLSNLQKIELMQNSPNPFNPSTAIKFFIPSASMVTIKVYDLLGREVISLVNDQLDAGYHIAYWDGKNSGGQIVSSGIYLYKLSAGDFSKSKKMNLLK